MRDLFLILFAISLLAFEIWGLKSHWEWAQHFTKKKRELD